MDLTTDDDLLTKDDPTPAELAKEFTRPPLSFKGQELRPYTAGTDLLFTQVLDRNDAPMTLILAFIFIHLRRSWKMEDGRSKAAGGEKSSSQLLSPGSDLLELCWNKARFRMALFEWIESLGELTIADKDAATSLFAEMREPAKRTSVEVVPDVTQKKTKASRRRR